MEEAYDAGKTKAIGVSNFRPKHLDALLKTAKVTPMVNQLFINPSDLEPEVVAYNDAHHILTEATAHLGQGSWSRTKVLPRLLKNMASPFLN